MDVQDNYWSWVLTKWGLFGLRSVICCEYSIYSLLFQFISICCTETRERLIFTTFTLHAHFSLPVRWCVTSAALMQLCFQQSQEPVSVCWTPPPPPICDLLRKTAIRKREQSQSKLNLIHDWVHRPWNKQW